MTVFGLLSLMATFLTLFLPETKDKEIPDDIQDVQDMKTFDKSVTDRKYQEIE